MKKEEGNPSKVLTLFAVLAGTVTVSFIPTMALKEGLGMGYQRGVQAEQARMARIMRGNLPNSGYRFASPLQTERDLVKPERYNQKYGVWQLETNRDGQTLQLCGPDGIKLRTIRFGKCEVPIATVTYDSKGTWIEARSNDPYHFWDQINHRE